MKAATRPPLHRLQVIDQMIREGGHPNAHVLAGRLEVHRRTILRDVDFLRHSWGAPLEYSRQHNGYFYSNPDFALPCLRLTEGELVAFFLAERPMQQYRDSPFAKDIASAFHKLTAALPDEVSIDLTHLAGAYSFRSKPATPGDVTRFRQLVRAVREGRQLELTYWSASQDQTSSRVVDPYHLTAVDGDWYLVGHCHLREAVRMFVPSRIRSLRETGQRFARPADFRIGNYLDSSFRTYRSDGPPQKVRLRFAASVSHYIQEKTWHPSQRLEARRDGSVILTMSVSHLLEVRRWVMGWGAECEVIEPAKLRSEIAAESRRVLRCYHGKAKAGAM